jgi:hypothetical protein
MERSKLILKYNDKGFPVLEIARMVPRSKTIITKVRKAKALLDGKTV